MGRFDALKTTIDANIRENGNQEITGEILNLVLNEMVSVVDDEKQDLLMDGVNIKTINGQKILGRGNITIEGGEGGGGGITEEKEVYIGEEAPTDDGAKLWIDPTGTPSQPSQPSADNGIRYFIVSEDVMSTIAQGEIYTFTGSQAEEARRLLYDWENYTYIIVLRFNGSHFNGSHFNADITYGNNAYVVLAPEAQLNKDAPERVLTVFIPAGHDAEGMIPSDLFNIWEEDGVFLAGM